MPTASRVRCRDESAGSNNSDTVKRSSSSKKQKTSSSSSNKKLSATAAAAAAKAGVGNGDIDGFYTVEKIVDHRVDKKTGTTTYLTRWVNYTPKDDTWEPLSNIDSTGHVDRYIRSQQSKTLHKDSVNVAVIEYDDGETELVNMTNEKYRPYNEEHDDDDMLYMDVDDSYENDTNLLIVGEKIEILWKYVKMYFPCKIISYVTPPSDSTTVPAIPPQSPLAERTTTLTSVIDYLKKAWSPSRL